MSDGYDVGALFYVARNDKKAGTKMNDKLHDYIEKLYDDRPALLMEMELFAKDENVPIMELDGIEVLLQWLRFQQPARILEVGTAIAILHYVWRMHFLILKLWQLIEMKID